MTEPDSGLIAAIRSVVASMLPDPQLVTGTVESVQISGGSLISVAVRCDDEVIDCDFADEVEAAALVPPGIVGRSAVVGFTGGPVVLVLYKIGSY